MSGVSYSYGINADGHKYFSVLANDKIASIIIDKDAVIEDEGVEVPHLDPAAQKEVERWIKFESVPSKVATQYRKILGYTKKSFDTVRSTFGADRNGSDEHATPPELLEFVRCFGNIALDPFGMTGSFVNALHNYTYPEQDGFKDSWSDFLVEKNARGNIWVNPPYSKLSDFAEMWVLEYAGIQYHQLATLMFGCVPNIKSEQDWYHQIMDKVDYKWEPKGRVNYWKAENGVLKPQSGVGFPSALLIADPNNLLPTIISDFSPETIKKIENTGTLTQITKIRF